MFWVVFGPWEVPAPLCEIMCMEVVCCACIHLVPGSGWEFGAVSEELFW